MIERQSVYRKRVIGTVDQYCDASAARGAVSGLLRAVNRSVIRLTFKPLTIAQLCVHFEQYELAHENSWRTLPIPMCRYRQFRAARTQLA